MLPPQQAVMNTVQSFPPKGMVGPGPLIYDLQRGPILPPRGTKERDRVLRLFDSYDFNSLWQGARSGIVKKLAAVEYDIDGPRTEAQYYHDLLGYSHFGHGWEYMTKRVLRDFFTQSYGGIWEIAGPGASDGPLFGRPTGINHLDAGRCYATGNLTYPIVYYSLWDGRLHKMHASRVYVMVDDPIPDERYFGIGTSALERAIAVVQREMRMGQYVDALLDDKPQPGILALRGVSDANWQQLLVKYLQEQGADERPTFGRVIVLTSVDPNADVKAEVIPFSQTPEKFDFIKYTDLDVNAVALAFGIDRQELWELGGRGLGSGSQSQVLAMKSRSKLYADVLNGIERFMNWAILPDSCEFKFKEHDQQQDQIQATIDVTYSQIAATLIQAGYDQKVITQLLADKSDTYEDAFTDEQGNVTMESFSRQIDQPLLPGVTHDVSLQSNTPVPNSAATANVSNANALGRENGLGATGATNAAGAAPHGLSSPSLGIRPASTGIKPLGAASGSRIPNQTRPNPGARSIGFRSKAFGNTSADFEQRFLSVSERISNGELTVQQGESQLLSLLLTSGRQAYLDGLELGGVNELDDTDEAEVQSFVADQVGFVENYANGIANDKPTREVLEGRTALWVNKSLTQMYNAGRVSADNNGYYVWELGATEKHCEDCQRLAGQVHRFKEWYSRGWLPQSDRLSCQGFQCDCRLKKTDGPGQGRFSYQESFT